MLEKAWLAAEPFLGGTNATIADLIAKIGFGFYLLANVDAPEAESAPLNQSSQQYV